VDSDGVDCDGVDSDGVDSDGVARVDDVAALADIVAAGVAIGIVATGAVVEVIPVGFGPAVAEVWVPVLPVTDGGIAAAIAGVCPAGSTTPGAVCKLDVVGKMGAIVWVVAVGAFTIVGDKAAGVIGGAWLGRVEREMFGAKGLVMIGTPEGACPPTGAGTMGDAPPAAGRPLSAGTKLPREMGTLTMGAGSAVAPAGVLRIGTKAAGVGPAGTARGTKGAVGLASVGIPGRSCSGNQ